MTNEPREECGRCGCAYPPEDFYGGVCPDCASDYYYEEQQRAEEGETQ